MRTSAGGKRTFFHASCARIVSAKAPDEQVTKRQLTHKETRGNHRLKALHISPATSLQCGVEREEWEVRSKLLIEDKLFIAAKHMRTQVHVSQVVAKPVAAASTLQPYLVHACIAASAYKRSLPRPLEDTRTFAKNSKLPPSLAK